MYTHDIPPEIAADPGIICDQKKKLEEIQAKMRQNGRQLLPPLPNSTNTKNGCSNSRSGNEDHGLELKKENSVQFFDSNTDTKSQSSFLQLIRPMIMDQINVAVQTYMDSQIRGIVEQSMASQLTLV